MGIYSEPAALVTVPTASTGIVAGDIVMATAAGLYVIGADTAGCLFAGIAVNDYDDGEVTIVHSGIVYLAADANGEAGQEAYIIDHDEVTHTGSTNTVKIGRVLYYVTSLTDVTQLSTAAGAGYVAVLITE